MNKPNKNKPRYSVFTEFIDEHVLLTQKGGVVVSGQLKKYTEGVFIIEPACLIFPNGLVTNVSGKIIIDRGAMQSLVKSKDVVK